MKKLSLRLGIALLCLAVSPLLAAPAAQTMTGWVTDSHCGLKDAGAKHTSACATKCAKDGTIQFVNDSDKKVYEVDKAHWDAAIAEVGHLVTVTGMVDGGAIAVSKIEAAKVGS
ncbi:MAG: hypothetical protein ABI609_11460 [Acidobacteriota bacterium]